MQPEHLEGDTWPMIEPVYEADIEIPEPLWTMEELADTPPLISQEELLAAAMPIFEVELSPLGDQPEPSVWEADPPSPFDPLPIEPLTGPLPDSTMRGPLPSEVP